MKTPQSPDDTVRFVNADTVITVIEEDKRDDNYELLQHNLRQLKTMRLLNGRQLVFMAGADAQGEQLEIADQLVRSLAMGDGIVGTVDGRS